MCIRDSHSRDGISFERQIAASSNELSANRQAVRLRTAPTRLDARVEVQADAESVVERRRADESSAERDLKPEGEQLGGAGHVVIRKTRNQQLSGDQILFSQDE